MTQRKLLDFLLPNIAQSTGQLLIERTILVHEADKLYLGYQNNLARELKPSSRARILLITFKK